MRTNSNLTVYNKHIDSETRGEIYQRTVIYDVAWENRKAANVLAAGEIAADQAVIYIPKARGDDYLAPRAWQALEDKTDNWTLQTGDFIVKGVVTDEITSEYTISDLKAEYDDVLRILSVDTMDIGSLSVQHWQVGAK